MNWKDKKVLVTGAGGFIGSHLCEVLLDLGSVVTGMVHYNSRNNWGNLEYLPTEKKNHLKVVSGNIEDSSFVNRVVPQQDIVFHLAALIAIPYSYIAPISYVRTNVEGTANILEAARSSHVERIIHTSTSETYGTALYTPIDEDHPLQGQSPYSASKIAADKLAESYYRSYDLPVITVRPFNTYGPRQSARAVIPTIMSQALTLKKVKLGSLKPVRDLTFVSDTVQGFIKIAESDGTIGQVVNIGTGNAVSVEELANGIISLLKMECPIIIDEERIRPEKSEVFNLICDNSKLQKLTGWVPTFPLETGLTRTLEFITKHLDAYKPEIYTI